MSKMIYSFIYHVTGKKELKKLIKTYPQKDMTKIAFDINKEVMTVNDIKNKKKYRAEMSLDYAGMSIYDFVGIDGNKENLNKKEINKLIEEIPLELFGVFSKIYSLENYVYIKRLYPIMIKMKTKTIQLNIDMIFCGKTVYFLIEPRDMDNPDKEITENLNELDLIGYSILNKSEEELEKIDEEEFFSKKRNKYKFLDFLYSKFLSEKKQKNILNKYYQKLLKNNPEKFYPQNIEIEEMQLNEFLYKYYELNFGRSIWLDNMFINKDEGNRNEVKVKINDLKGKDYRSFHSGDSVRRIISKNSNISIYENESQKKKLFLKNLVEGFIILHIYNEYEEINGNNNINPHNLKKESSLNRIINWRTFGVFSEEFYEEVLELKYIKKLEIEFQNKLNYSKAYFDQQLVKEQKFTNILIIIVALVTCAISIYQVSAT